MRNWRVFDPARADAGLDHVSPHDLRHTAASLAIASGATVKAVQSMLGHASAAMTLDIYASLLPMSWTPWPMRLTLLCHKRATSSRWGQELRQSLPCQTPKKTTLTRYFVGVGRVGLEPTTQGL